LFLVMGEPGPVGAYCGGSSHRAGTPPGVLNRLVGQERGYFYRGRGVGLLTAFAAHPCAVDAVLMAALRAHS
jgi:hypothetical protein